MALKISTPNNCSYYRLFITNRGGISGDTSLITNAIYVQDIQVIDDSRVRCVDTAKREYILSPEGENGWTLWSKRELNGLITGMRDERLKVEKIGDFFNHIQTRATDNS